jgi:hypothetical protein
MKHKKLIKDGNWYNPLQKKALCRKVRKNSFPNGAVANPPTKLI